MGGKQLHNSEAEESGRGIRKEKEAGIEMKEDRGRRKDPNRRKRKGEETA